MKAKSCFDKGQRITEIGAALAYAEFHAARLSRGGGNMALTDVASGIHTAAAKSRELGKTLKGKDRKALEKIAGNLDNMKSRIQGGWTVLNPSESTRIQRETSMLRRQVTEVWKDLRGECSGKKTK